MSSSEENKLYKCISCGKMVMAKDMIRKETCIPCLQSGRASDYWD